MPIEEEVADAAPEARAVVRLTAPKFDGLADQVWCFGMATDDRRRALGLVSQMAADLLLGADAMFEQRRAYAGASLVRQLIETDYLLFLFALDPDEPTKWLRGTVEEHKKLFMPAAMRQRAAGRFDVDEYADHCEMGGHPRPAGRSLFDRHHLTSGDPLPMLWMDLAIHAARVWEHYKLAVVDCSPTNVYPERFAELDAVFDTWLAGSASLRRRALGEAAAAKKSRQP